MAINTDLSLNNQELQKLNLNVGKAGHEMAKGTLFEASTGLFSDVSDDFKWLFENPSGSGKIARIVGFIMWSNAEAVKSLLLNPTNNPATTERTVRSRVLDTSGLETSAMKMKADESAGEMTAGDGEDTGLSVVIGSKLDISRYHATLEPGNEIGFNVTGGGALGSTPDINISLTYYEEDV